MMDSSAPAQRIRSRLRSHWRLATLIASLFVAVILISCATVTRTVVAPPDVPGAEFVGSKTCAECHENISRDFPTATHAKLEVRGPNAVNMGCEACHGPGSIHNQTGGARNTIVNPNRSPEVCFNCHLDKRGEFNLPHAHPVLHDKMSCSDCHNPHKSHAIIAGGTSLMGDNETCYRCHTQQRGPFVYEHEASREGCLICHKPHGSVNEKLLTERNATLCLKCHFQHQTAVGQILIGGRDHSQFLSRGTCWSAGCHEAVHGSHVNSSLRF
jgi:predicted CXXCH cytochrome family protein